MKPQRQPDSSAVPPPQSLVDRVFAKTPLELFWLLSIGAAVTFIGFPVQRILLVIWVRGSDAYFHQGIRVLKGKPPKFSDGQLVPSFPDFVLGMAMFFIVATSLTFLYMLILSFFDRRELKHVREAAIRQVDRQG